MRVRKYAGIGVIAGAALMVAGCGDSQATAPSDTTPIVTATTPTVSTRPDPQATARPPSTTSTTPTETTPTTTTQTAPSAEPLVAPPSPAGSQRVTSSDGSLSVAVNPKWTQAAADLAPPGGATWFTNLAAGREPGSTTEALIVSTEPLIGGSLAEDVTKSIQEQRLTLRDRRAATLGDGSPGEWIDTLQVDTRFVAVVSLDASGTKTISAAFVGPDTPGFERRLRAMQPYLLSLLKAG